MAALRALRDRFVARPDEALLRKLWQIRVEHLRLAKDPDADWQAFRDVFAQDETGAVVLDDARGEPQGFYSLAMIPIAHAGRRAVLLNAKYWYIRKGFRGGPAVLLAGLKLLPLAVRRFGLRSLYFVTTAFPLSYASLTRSIGQSYCLQKADTPAWERHALEVFASRYPTFDAGLGLVLGQAVPEELESPSAEAQHLIEEYERLNPGWREGRTMPLLLPVNGRTLAHTIGRTVRRLRRGRSRRGSTKAR